METSLPSLLALAELLTGPRDEDELGQGQSSSESNLGPGHIGTSKTVEPTATTHVKSGNSKEIWSVEDVQEGSEYDDSWDHREQPKYEILFKQQVGTEDLFLGMNRKDTSTACCEDMLVSWPVSGKESLWMLGGRYLVPEELQRTLEVAIFDKIILTKIKIDLPDTKASDITLDIKEKVLDLRSPEKKLLLHLPHPVDPNEGKACFLPEKGTLEVTLRMKREFDFINFA